MSLDSVGIFGLHNGITLAEQICSKLEINPGRILIGRNREGGTYLKIAECVRGKSIYIVQSGFPNTDQMIMQLYYAIDAFRRASAGEISVIMPFFPYGGDAKKNDSRIPIFAKAIARLIETAGARRIISIEFHSGEIQGFFEVPAEHLYASPIFIPDIEERFRNRDMLVIVDPDGGSVPVAKKYAKYLRAGFALADKDSGEILGEVNGKIAIVLDDSIISGKTLKKCGDALRGHRATQVHAYVTHNLAGEITVKDLLGEPYETITIADTIVQESGVRNIDQLRVLQVAPLFAEAIKQIHYHESIGKLFLW